MRYGSIGWSVGATLGYAAACAQEVFDVKACDENQMARIHMKESRQAEQGVDKKEGPTDNSPAGAAAEKEDGGGV